MVFNFVKHENHDLRSSNLGFGLNITGYIIIYIPIENDISCH
jgi:hypothetical protein